MAVPQCVFNDVPIQRLEMPKSVIFTQIGESDATRMCVRQLVAEESESYGTAEFDLWL